MAVISMPDSPQFTQSIVKLEKEKFISISDMNAINSVLLSNTGWLKKEAYKLQVPTTDSDGDIDLNTTKNGGTVFAGTVSVKHGPTGDTIGDGILFQPGFNFGWQLLGRDGGGDRRTIL